MDVDEGSASVSSRGAQSLPANSRRQKAYYLFTQQRLPACKPVLTPAWVISIFLSLGILFIPIGLVTLHASRNYLYFNGKMDAHSYAATGERNLQKPTFPKYDWFIALVVEIVERYDTECVPKEFRSDKLAYIRDNSIPKNCSRHLKVHRSMKAPIYIYYQLDNYYQNHRRYVKSRSDQQLLHGLEYNDTSSCKPAESHNGLPIVPCGLIAWSLFNDTFKFVRGASELKVSRNNIAWKSDRDHKYGKHVYPFNFQNGTLIGGGKLDPRIPLSDQEDLIVWMRTAALPSFRKLYGRIEEDLDSDDVINVKLMNNYNTYSFGGRKKLVLSTSTWLGGKNDFLGMAYIFVGCFSILVSIVFMLLHMKCTRPYGDTAYLPWNRKSSSS